jgi:hypothetical protein
MKYAIHSLRIGNCFLNLPPLLLTVAIRNVVCQRTFLRMQINIAVYIFIGLSSVNRIITAMLKICEELLFRRELFPVFKITCSAALLLQLFEAELCLRLGLSAGGDCNAIVFVVWCE